MQPPFIEPFRFSARPPQRLPWEIFLVATLFLGGCATSVEFHDQAGKNAGFEYYPSKPYLLVQQDQKGIRTTTLLAIPDVTRPHRIKHKPGWGTVDFSFKISNGMLTEFGESFDSKGPETITAVAGGISSLVGAVAPLAGAAPGTELFQVTPVKEALDLLQTEVIDRLPGATDPALREVRTRIASVKAGLDPLKVLTIPPGSDLHTVLAEHQKKVKPFIAPLKTELEVLQMIKDNDRLASDVTAAALRAHKYLSNAIKLLEGFVNVPKDIELYEIIDEDGKVRFQRVAFP